MNIGIDARWIFQETSGIGAYTAALIRALAAEPSGNRFSLFFHDPACRDRIMTDTVIAAAGDCVRAVMLPFGLFDPSGQWRLHGHLRTAGIDVFHSTNYLIPLPAFPRSRRGRIKSVVTIHDVIPLLFPDAAPRSLKSRFFFIYRRLMIEIGRRAHAIISDSEASRRDVIRHLCLPPARHADVAAIACGVDGSIFAPAAEAPALSDSGTRRRTVLYVGRADPYKNLVGLLQALQRIRATCPFPVDLRIVGPPDSRYPEARQAARDLGLEAAVAWTGYLTEPQLVQAYRDADLLALPSFYEGFGLPVIEAMACGTPVVCSNRGALPEVAGDAAMVVDPEVPGALADGILHVLTDPVLRARLRRCGRQRAQTFSWQRTARATLAVYGRVLNPETGR